MRLTISTSTMNDPSAVPHGLERSHRYFCYVCGTLLPHKLEATDSLICRKCHTPTFMHWFNGMEVSFTNELRGRDWSSLQNTDSDYFKPMLKRAKKILKSELTLKQALESQYADEPSQDGPSIRKECAYCGNDRMTYVTLQTRSADEGQTVIYTCTQCAKKEVENT
ncbi:DNA-directed RNA polymerase I subunit RPA12 [Clonorchis sinensis]|uniref:DNA-directed RNA polymerase I subunit RPA12 n=2 Tax=Clonorchis sinensis TaxID=79923 RepID=G7YTD6_CLOSI|nr:DNA-directed RNA polymerase I subunit RPA12 [Clonorchis sinensis]